jgi:type IV secretory pathway TrbD component
MNIDATDVSEMVAYQRGVRRPQFLAGCFRFLGLFGLIVSGIAVVLAIATQELMAALYGLGSLFSALFLLAISALLDWCAVLLMTLRYGTAAEDR